MLKCTRQVHVGTTTLLYTKTNLQISDRAKNLITYKKASVIYSPELFCLCYDYAGCPQRRPLRNVIYHTAIIHYSFFTIHLLTRYVINAVPYTFWRTNNVRPYEIYCIHNTTQKESLAALFLLRILNYSFTYALTYVN